jgi:hypothetical protein
MHVWLPKDRSAMQNCQLSLRLRYLCTHGCSFFVCVCESTHGCSRQCSEINMKGPERKKGLEKDMMTVDHRNSFKLGYDKSEELSLVIILKCGRAPVYIASSNLCTIENVLLAK